MTAAQIQFARDKVKEDLRYSGEFQCHVTVYDKDGKMLPSEGFRQCAGAAKYYREGGGLD